MSNASRACTIVLQIALYSNTGIGRAFPTDVTTNPPIAELRIENVLNPLMANMRVARDLRQWMLGHFKAACRHKIIKLTHIGQGYHFKAQQLLAENLAGFSVDAMAKDYAAKAPLTWDLFGCLLDAFGSGTELGSDGGTDAGLEADLGVINNNVEPLLPGKRRRAGASHRDQAEGGGQGDEGEPELSDLNSDYEDDEEDHVERTVRKARERRLVMLILVSEISSWSLRQI